MNFESQETIKSLRFA